MHKFILGDREFPLTDDDVFYLSLAIPIYSGDIDSPALSQLVRALEDFGDDEAFIGWADPENQEGADND